MLDPTDDAVTDDTAPWSAPGASWAVPDTRTPGDSSGFSLGATLPLRFDRPHRRSIHDTLFVDGAALAG